MNAYQEKTIKFKDSSRSFPEASGRNVDQTGTEIEPAELGI